MPLLGSKNLQRLISFSLIFFSLEISLHILKVSGPDILIIAIPHGPLPEDRAKIFISLNLGLQLF